MDHTIFPKLIDTIRPETHFYYDFSRNFKLFNILMKTAAFHITCH